jgi:hypothetical protein
MKYQSSITYHSKDMANVKVFADRQTNRPKTICPQSFDTGHKNDSPIIYNSKDMANVKVFEDIQTGQKLHAPHLLIRRHKKQEAHGPHRSPE